jgi:hypothetical protein
VFYRCKIAYSNKPILDTFRKTSFRDIRNTSSLLLLSSSDEEPEADGVVPLLMFLAYFEGVA